MIKTCFIESLRRDDAERSVLVPMGLPAELSAGPWVPVAEKVDSDGRTIMLVADGGRLALAGGGRLTPVATLGSAPICAVASPTGFAVMADDGLWYVDVPRGESPSLRRAAADYPELQIRVKSRGTVSESVESLKINNVSVDASSPLGRNAGVLTDSLLTAYDNVTAHASAAGLFTAPVLVRYRLVGQHGETLFHSEPIMVGDGPGPGIMSASASISGSVMTLASFLVETRTYEMVVAIPPFAREFGIAYIDIEVSPQLHPIDFNGRAWHRLENPRGDNQVLSFRMPAAIPPVGELLGRLDRIFSTVARFVPGESGYDATVGNRDRRGAGADGVAVGRLLSLPLATRDFSSDLLAAVGQQGMFSAGAGCVSGDVTLWADITTVGDDRFPLAFNASASVDGPWQGRVRLSRRGGLPRVLRCGGDSLCPIELYPMLSCRGGHWERMEIFVSGPDGCRYGSFGLVPSADGLRSYCCVSPGENIVLELSDKELPEPSGIEAERWPGAVVACRSYAPGNPVSALLSGHAPVSALTPSLRSQSSWDFSRGHFYAFTGNGTLALSVNVARRLVSSTMIDSRPVSASGSVALSPEGVLAVAGGDLVMVAGARAVTLVRNCGAVSAGYVAPNDEIALLDPEGDMRIVTKSALLPVSRTLPFSVTRLTTLPSGLYLTSDSALYSAGDETFDNTVAIAWKGVLSFRGIAAGVRVAMAASRFVGGITILADSEQRQVASLTLSGRIDSPVFVPVLGPVRGTLAVSIAGEVSSDFRLDTDLKIVAP